jgi:hypothetical protein
MNERNEKQQCSGRMPSHLNLPVVSGMQRDARDELVQGREDVCDTSGRNQFFVRMQQDARDARDPVDERKAQHPGQPDDEAAEQQPPPPQRQRKARGEHHGGDRDRNSRNRSRANSWEHLRVQRRKAVGVNNPVDSAGRQREVDEHDRYREANDRWPRRAVVTQPRGHSRSLVMTPE